ncbi:MAG: hypothetical protein OXH52_15210 [Gammaproteobacteria bacterium]|nr:hypothetical protein [Gammaproteobacteria bacterium]
MRRVWRSPRGRDGVRGALDARNTRTMADNAMDEVPDTIPPGSVGDA